MSFLVQWNYFCFVQRNTTLKGLRLKGWRAEIRLTKTCPHYVCPVCSHSCIYIFSTYIFVEEFVWRCTTAYCTIYPFMHVCTPCNSHVMWSIAWKTDENPFSIFDQYIKWTVKIQCKPFACAVVNSCIFDMMQLQRFVSCS